MNNVSLIGRTTNDIELRTTTSGKSVVNFTLAVYINKDETLFQDCEAWDNAATKLATYVHKGNSVGITGRLKPKHWEKDGKKYSKNIVSVFDVDLSFIEKKTSQIEPQEQRKPTPYDLEHNPDYEPNAFSVLPDENTFIPNDEGLPF